MQSIKIKAPQTDYDVHPLIRKRWSPRSFTDQMIPEAQLLELFDAARWAASAFNGQPWEYVYAFRGTAGFEQLWACLNSGNQPWTKTASVLVVAIARTNMPGNGKTNPWAEHDLGMANAQLILQAAHRDIYGHFMAGFNKEKLNSTLKLDETRNPVCMIALGYLGDTDILEEPFRTRELTPRNRKPIQDFATAF